MFPITGSRYDPQRKIWSGPRIKDLYSGALTLGEVVLRELRKHPHKVIQILDTTGEELTSQQFLDYSRILAEKLMEMEVRPKDIIGLYASNTTHVTTVMMAAFLMGAPVNAIYPEFDKDNLKLLFQQTLPKLIFCDVENYHIAHEACEEMKLNARIVVMNGNVENVLCIRDLLVTQSAQVLDSLVFPCVHMNGSDTAVILCSSGTTGTPKGVLVSHYALLNKVLYPTVKSDSVLFCFSTMYWGSGLINMLASLLNSTLRIITVQPYTSAYLLKLVERYGVTHLIASGTQMAELILNHDQAEIRNSLASVDTLFCGGAKVPLLVQEQLLKILSDNPNRPGFSVIYGMSEVAGAITFNAGPPFAFHIGTEGKIVPNTQIRIVDKEGKNLGPNESGEILIASPYNCQGYYKNPEATAKAFSGEWLHSGDIGCFDDAGFLRLSGRDKDMFKYKSFQIYPQLIEDVILHIPGVAEVCVFPQPNLLTDNVIACAIVRSSDVAGKSLSKDMVMKYVSEHLDQLYHLRGGVYFIHGIPKTSSGKIQRQIVPKLVANDAEK